MFSNRVQFRGRHFEAVTSSQSRPHPSGTTCARRRTLSDPRCTHSPRTPQLRCPGKIVFGADVLVSAPNSRRDSSNVRPNKHLRSFFAFPFIIVFFSRACFELCFRLEAFVFRPSSLGLPGLRFAFLSTAFIICGGARSRGLFPLRSR